MSSNDPCDVHGDYCGMEPFDPTYPENYEILENLWAEIHELFPDKIFHLGGDETEGHCWFNDERVKTWAADQGFCVRNKHCITQDVQRYHMEKMYEICKKLGLKYQVWDEVFSKPEEGEEIDENLTIHIWKPWGAHVFTGWQPKMKAATKAGYNTVLSTTWYLDLMYYPSTGHRLDWTKFYHTDPTDFNGSEEEKARVLGGEGCYWTEYVDSSGVVHRTFPRLSAIAERLWSDIDATRDKEDAFPRLDKFRCDMISRGINAEPVAVPSACGLEYDLGYVAPWDQDTPDPSPEPTTTSGPTTTSCPSPEPLTTSDSFGLFFSLFLAFSLCVL